jgi:hypothetical protein
MNELSSAEERRIVTTVITEAHEQSWGIACGLLLGLALFTATNVLVVKGGDRVGPHLSLLSVYLPGYSVTFLGSLIGFVYLFVIGYGVARCIVTIYNRLSARMR